MYCPKCGTELQSNAKFCPSCGMQVSRSAADANDPEGELQNPGKPEADRKRGHHPFFWFLVVGLPVIAVGVALGWVFFATGGVHGSEAGANRVQTITAGSGSSAAILDDGTVVAVGYNEDGQCNVSDWTDIVDISMGGEDWSMTLNPDGSMIPTGGPHCVGVKSDGRVVATGANDQGQCGVEQWSDIVQVSAGADYTVGLRSNGSVVATPYHGSSSIEDKSKADVDGWSDIVQVSASDYHTVGLKSDGTVVATGNNEYDQCEVNDWEGIVDVSAGSMYTVGLASDGTVFVTGDNAPDLSGLNGVKAVSTGYQFIAGLTPEGEVLVASQENGWIPTSLGWADIVEIAAGGHHLLGLHSNGTVSAWGYDLGVSYGNYGQCDVSGWKDVRLPYSNEEGVSGSSIERNDDSISSSSDGGSNGSGRPSSAQDVYSDGYSESLDQINDIHNSNGG